MSDNLREWVVYFVVLGLLFMPAIVQGLYGSSMQ
jgi:hypothetical protein